MNTAMGRKNPDISELRAKYGELVKSELFDRCAPFWFRGMDEEDGGILQCLDNEGSVYATDKALWMQGRTAWTYATLYRLFGKKPEYLSMAKTCLDFSERHGFDPNGRMYLTVTKKGDPVSQIPGEWFSEAFYLSGCAAYYSATGEKVYLEKAKKTYETVLSLYLGKIPDPTVADNGFRSSRPMKALNRPMILLNLTGIMRRADSGNDAYYNAIADGLIADIRCFYDEKNACMRETVGTDNRFVDDCSDSRVVNPGHDIELSWFLLEEGLYRKDESLKAFAKTVFDNAISAGWDKEYGGLTYYLDALGRPMELLEFDMRIWWAQSEAIIASLMMYRTFGEEQYKEWFIKNMDYGFAHFSDREHGEWYGMLHRDGTPTRPPFKGHTYKGAFHVMRMLMKTTLMLENREED